MKGHTPLASLAGVGDDDVAKAIVPMLEQALAEVDRGGSPRDLRRALLRLESRPELSFSAAQARALRAAKARRDLLAREADLLAALRAGAPRGARAAVTTAEGGLVGTVTFPGPALRAGAGEGWQLRGDALEFAGGGRPFGELAQLEVAAQHSFLLGLASQGLAVAAGAGAASPGKKAKPAR